MGCCSHFNIVQPPQPLMQLPMPEITIRKNERDSLFAKKPLSKIAESFNKEGLNKKLSLNQYKRALHDFGIDPTVLEEVDNPMWSYFFSFQDGSLFDLSKLIVSAVLLSTSEAQKKVKVLFTHYDENSDRVLEPNELKTMIAQMFEVSVDHTTLMSIGEGPNKLNSEELCRYTTFLNEEKAKFVSEVYTTLIGNATDMGVKELEDALDSKKDISRILSSGGIRELVLHKYKENKHY